MIYKKYNYDSYNIYTITTDRFKNCYMEITFRENIQNVNLSARNLLVNLMGYTSSKYPTQREMKIQKEELYNPYLTGNLGRVGENLFTSFSIDFLNPKYIKEKDYLENNIAFCFELLQNPHRENGKWDEKSFKLFKEQAHVALEEYKEKPTSYALMESKKEFFGDSILSKRLLGSHEELDEVTEETVSFEYDGLLENSSCDILIIGNLSMDEVVKYIKKYFYKPSIVLDKIPFQTNIETKEFKSVTVNGPYNQTQLVMYYKLNSLTEWERNYVVSIFGRILGASSGMNDKLTKYLRIEHSLCYYCGCQMNPNDFLCTIYVGLSKENVKEAVACIEKAISEMASGKIDEDFIEIQKRKFLADLKLREDSIYGLMDNYYFHELNGSPMYQDYVTNIPQITLKDLKKFGKKLIKICQYVLEEESHERN